jgi:hypothetical protein
MNFSFFRKNMNILLEKLLQESPFDDRDKYEIRQIFQFVTDEKKQNILNNFDYIVSNVLKLKEDLRQQQEILLGKAISNIEQTILKAK